MNLKEIRKEAGLSRTKVCELSGVPYDTWTSWENKGTNYSRRTPEIAVRWLNNYIELEALRKKVELYQQIIIGAGHDNKGTA